MNKLKNAFTILYVISSIDGDTSASENELIMKFLNDNQGEINFDPKEVMKSIVLLDELDQEEKLTEAAEEFKGVASEEEKLNLLNFALNLVISDGKIKTEEIQMFNILGKIWNIEISKLIDFNLKK